jgi:hypothetical protein
MPEEGIAPQPNAPHIGPRASLDRPQVSPPNGIAGRRALIGSASALARPEPSAFDALPREVLEQIAGSMDRDALENFRQTGRRCNAAGLTSVQSLVVRTREDLAAALAAYKRGGVVKLTVEFEGTHGW